MFCMNCGYQMNDDEKVCPKCGTALEEDVEVEETVKEEVVSEETSESEIGPEPQPEPQLQQESFTTAGVFCHQCGTQNDGGNAFCSSCGARLQTADGAVIETGTMNSGKAVAVKKLPVKKILLVVLLVVLVGVVLCIGSFIFKKVFHKEADIERITYLADNELWTTKYNKIDPMMIDDDIYSDRAAGAELGYYGGLEYSEDGKYVFYLKDLDDSESGLYYKKLKEDAEDVKIDSNVIDFQITSDNRVVYNRGDNAGLYVYNLKDKEKIAKNVIDFRIDKTGKNIIWINDEGDLYTQELSLKKDKEKMDDGVTELTAASDDLSKVIYEKAVNDQDGNLYVFDIYMMKSLTDCSKLASDANYCTVTDINDNLQLYYTKQEQTSSGTMMDFVEDDFAGDAGITEPNIDDYTTITMVPSFWGEREDKSVDDVYYDKLSEYEEKCSRDSVRDFLGKMETSFPNTTLYYYSDSLSESTEIASGFVEVLFSSYDVADSPIVYYYFDPNDIPKIKLSQIMEDDSYGSTALTDEIENEIYEKQQIYVAVKDVSAPVDASGIYNWDTQYSENENCLYMLMLEDEEENGGDIIKINCDELDLGSSEIYASDVYSIVRIQDNELYYLCDYDTDDNSGTLYCNQEKLDDDVVPAYMYESIPENAGFVYYTDWDDDDLMGTLNYYDGSECSKIADDVSDYFICDRNKIAVLMDYSSYSYTGDLKYYNGKKLIKIASDVNCLVK